MDPGKCDVRLHWRRRYAPSSHQVSWMIIHDVTTEETPYAGVPFTHHHRAIQVDLSA